MKNVEGIYLDRTESKIRGISRDDVIEPRRGRCRNLEVVLEIVASQRVGTDQRLRVDGQNLKGAQSGRECAPRVAAATRFRKLP